MFYIYFIFIILLVLIALWAGMWLYKIHAIMHSAQELFGKLIRLYDKRHELLEKFINNKDFTSSAFSGNLSYIISKLSSSKQTKDIYEKLKIEHEISEAIKDFEFDRDIVVINEEVHKIVEEYNFLAEKLNSLSKKILVKSLFKVFKINLLNKIEV